MNPHRTSALFCFSLIVLIVGILAGCGQPSNYHAESSSENSSENLSENLSPAAPIESPLEAYRNRKKLIELAPGNRNRQISWATLYQMMPGETEIVAFDSDGSVIREGATSTKLQFKEWAFDPEGLRIQLDRQFESTLRSFFREKSLKNELIRAGQAHDIDPVLVFACLVAEGTFGSDLKNDFQTWAVAAVQWAAKWTLRFRAGDVDLARLIERREFEVCREGVRSGGPQSEYWDCVGAVWRNNFRNKSIDGSSEHYPNQSLKQAFFNPLGLGFTYGIGQLDPIRALMVTDRVNKKSGFRLLTIDRPEDIYHDINQPQTSVHYVAATLRLIIDTYKKRAGFDISKNPGVVASLYNLGGEKARASALYRANLESLKTGSFVMPVENYYGFYVNEKEAMMRRSFERWSR